MEQFLRDFFNDNSLCVGLCDLKRKTANDVRNQAPFVQSKPTQQQTFTFEKPKVQPSQVQKPQRQTLAQKFAEQQQAYAARQAYIAQQRQKFAQEQAIQQRVVEQKAVYSQSRPVFVNPNAYIEKPAQQKSQTKVIVNGNMKKVVSPAVPARCK